MLVRPLSVSCRGWVLRTLASAMGGAEAEQRVTLPASLVARLSQQAVGMARRSRYENHDQELAAADNLPAVPHPPCERIEHARNGLTRVRWLMPWTN